tara:strand:+ start:3427 stop:4302 length:876 start_codon:yes stop_codon:yes gene_type:complete
MEKKKIILKKSDFGHFFVKNVPSKSNLEKYYKSKYFNINPRYFKKSKEYEEKYFEYTSKIRFEFLKSNLINKSKPTLLDIGVGTGRFLFYTKNYVRKSVGIDYSVDQISYKFGKKTKLIGLNPVEFLKSNNLKFDIITLNNVVEHSDNVNELFDLLSKKVSKKTLILICLPNDFSTLQKYLFKNKFVKSKYWIAYPDHLQYFNSENFVKFLIDRKFKIVDAIGDYPVETLLLNSHFNYTNKKLNIGKSVHELRCNFIKFIYENSNMTNIIEFFRSCYKLKIGRNNYFIIKK